MIRRTLNLAAVIPFIILPLWLAAIAFEALSKRQMTYQYISDALDPLSVTESNVKWIKPEAMLARQLTTADKKRAGEVLTAAWQALAAAQSTGNEYILTDSFIGVALDRAQKSVSDASVHGGRIAVLQQSAQPLFFHKDGTVLQLELQTVTARYLVSDQDLIHHQITHDTGVVTLIQQTRGWRVFSYERRSEVPLRLIKPRWNRANLYGVNYYPSDTPWRNFWRDFDVQIISRDMDHVKNLGGNVVRIFLSYQDFLDPTTAKINITNLTQFLDIARKKRLLVIPTLFDLKPSFGPGTWAIDVEYLEGVLPVLATSNQIAFIDIKNEANLDFVAHDKAEILAWLRTMIALTRELSPETPISIGWSSSAHAGTLVDDLDVVSYHAFGAPKDTETGLRRARALSNGLPVVVSEIGASSYSFAFGLPGSEGRQARILRDQLKKLENSAGVLVWTLHDFDEVDPSVFGVSPWRRNLQTAFGLYRVDGSEKPAARVVRQAFSSSGEN